ncbi:MAG: DUF1800 domain-containing protein [Porticoccaceae bacterium]|nr:DUF1800 domain-containing protein [Porticoccaceae bacterium]
MVSEKTVIAATRFGFGEPPASLKHIGSQYHDWLSSQLTPQSTAKLLEKIPNSATLLMENLEMRKQRRMDRKANKPVAPFGKILRKHYVEQAAARTRLAMETEHPFYERLVQFWSNHFAISVDKPQVLSIAGCYENEAIRPYILGPFRNLLMSVVGHPAMLVYLDNWTSVGPNSKVGKRRNRGLNENLAREVLELHTLGVDGGYQQSDVIALAKALTGWSVGGVRPRVGGKAGKFHFLNNTHEPGSVTLLGKRYSQSKVKQATAILDDLALHPSTAAFIGSKLYRHFISEQLDTSAVEQLKQAFLKSDGDLTAVYRVLLNLKQSWQPVAQKFKTPNELVISTYRSLQLPAANNRQLVGLMNQLGQPLFRPGSPAGWPERSSHWDGGTLLMKRIEWIDALSDRLASSVNPVELATGLLGPLLSERTETAVKRAESPAQSLALLLLSPEFQRR